VFSSFAKPNWGVVAVPVRSTNFYLIKIARLTGWVLFGLMLVYIITGFALCGKLGMDKLIGIESALAIHQLFDWPLVCVFVIHSSIMIYFALRRWGWIGRRNRHLRAAPNSTHRAKKELVRPLA